MSVPEVRWFRVEYVLGNDEYYLFDLTMQQIQMQQMLENGVIPIPNPMPLCFVKCSEKLKVNDFLKGEITGLIPLSKPVNHGLTEEDIASQGTFVLHVLLCPASRTWKSETTRKGRIPPSPGHIRSVWG